MVELHFKDLDAEVDRKHDFIIPVPRVLFLVLGWNLLLFDAIVGRDGLSCPFPWLYRVA